MGNPLQYLAWRITWTEEPDRLLSMGLQRVGHTWATSLLLSPMRHYTHWLIRKNANRIFRSDALLMTSSLNCWGLLLIKTKLIWTPSPNWISQGQISCSIYIFTYVYKHTIILAGGLNRSRFRKPLPKCWAFLMAQMVKNLPAMKETWVQFLGKEDLLEKVTHLSIPAWRIPWTEEPEGLQFTESQRAGHDWVTNTFRLSEMRMWGRTKTQQLTA